MDHMEFKHIDAAEARTKAEAILRSLPGLSVATNGENGYPDLRALAIGHVDDVQTIWFSTSSCSKKLKELAADPRATLYGFDMQSMGEFRLFGSFEVRTDTESRKKVWKDEYKAYWPDGIDSPNMTVLKFTTKSGIYASFGETGTFEF